MCPIPHKVRGPQEPAHLAQGPCWFPGPLGPGLFQADVSGLRSHQAVTGKVSRPAGTVSPRTEHLCGHLCLPTHFSMCPMRTPLGRVASPTSSRGWGGAGGNWKGRNGRGPLCKLTAHQELGTYSLETEPPWEKCGWWSTERLCSFPR